MEHILCQQMLLVTPSPLTAVLKAVPKHAEGKSVVLIHHCVAIAIRPDTAHVHFDSLCPNAAPAQIQIRNLKSHVMQVEL